MSDSFTPVTHKRKTKGKQAANAQDPIALAKKGKAPEKNAPADEDELIPAADEDEGDADDDELMVGDGADFSSGAGRPSIAGGEAPTSGMDVDTSVPSFAPISKAAQQAATQADQVTRGQLRKVPIPPHRMTPLKNDWAKIFSPLVEMAGLQVRMNAKRRMVEIKVSLCRSAG